MVRSARMDSATPQECAMPNAAAGAGSLVLGIDAGTGLVDHLSSAARQAVAAVGPEQIKQVVVGAAGVIRYTRGATVGPLAQVWDSVGFTCPVTVVADAVTAFAAGTAQRRG